MKYFIFLLFPTFLLSQNNILSTEQSLFVMFYNVENLFDTINNPIKNDDEFTPNSKKHWNSERYNHKINKLEQVFASINDSLLPNIIGLSEVENKLVIEDLLKAPFFKHHNYTIIHQESPDQRGIDCAILFDDQFELLKYDFIEINNPASSRPTRDIVYVKLKFQNEFFHVFVNHWPSRWGGVETTNHKRVFTAKTLQNYIKTNIKMDENVLIMGDFNDYPFNESVKDVLVKNDFFNLMSSDIVADSGSYNYKGEWNFIDHVIVSNNLRNRVLSAGAFSKDWMLYTNNKGEKYPSRTYGRDSWYGGFSDHLPVYCRIRILSN
ncbi:MAG: endonuclease [Flavobacteriales bacterium]|nr:endonuclease [Flavobacteriales bacterium]|tara:strand:- start:1405 stop:2370 length:966 start_codon:yes stop_codon:yes gene_type:complete